MLLFDVIVCRISDIVENLWDSYVHFVGLIEVDAPQTIVVWCPNLSHMSAFIVSHIISYVSVLITLTWCGALPSVTGGFVVAAVRGFDTIIQSCSSVFCREILSAPCSRSRNHGSSCLVMWCVVLSYCVECGYVVRLRPGMWRLCIIRPLWYLSKSLMLYYWLKANLQMLCSTLQNYVVSQCCDATLSILNMLVLWRLVSSIYARACGHLYRQSYRHCSHVVVLFVCFSREYSIAIENEHIFGCGGLFVCRRWSEHALCIFEINVVLWYHECCMFTISTTPGVFCSRIWFMHLCIFCPFDYDIRVRR